MKTRKDTPDDKQVADTFYLPDKEVSEEKSSLNEFIVVMVFPCGKEDADVKNHHGKTDKPFLIKIQKKSKYFSNFYNLFL